MNKLEKNKMIELLDGMLNENNNFYLADISGLTAEESSALRRLCFKRNVFPHPAPRDVIKILHPWSMYSYAFSCSKVNVILYSFTIN